MPILLNSTLVTGPETFIREIDFSQIILPKMRAIFDFWQFFAKKMPYKQNSKFCYQSNVSLERCMLTSSPLHVYVMTYVCSMNFEIQ